MKEPIDYKILNNFSRGKYSLKEYKLTARWFNDRAYEDELKEVIGQHWEEFSMDASEQTKDLSSVFNRLKQKIETRRSSPTLKSRVLTIYSGVAAILLVPLFLYSVYSILLQSEAPEKPVWVEINSPQGARTHFQLPDGTIGWLNSGTHLKYATNFENNRHVELEGEAWFEVTHNEKKPFLVSTANLNIKVLGTKFNVSAMPSESVTEVVLEEGKVNVTSKDAVFSSLMKPDQKLTYNTELHTSNIQKVNAEQICAWKDGLLLFRNEPLSEVLKKIGFWYNVSFIIEDPELAKFKYRASFRDEQVEEVIRLIALTVPIEYSIENRKIDSNGIFEQKRITVRRKTN